MKKHLAAVAGLLLFGAAYYTLSPLFRNSRLDDQLPQRTPSSTGTTTEASQTILRAPIVATLAHPASGTARIVSDGDRQYLRYEDFSTINGPDLHVYLSKDLGAMEFVDLGEIKATQGNVNYEIPAGITSEEYPYALVWCKAFGVLFNSAKLL